MEGPSAYRRYATECLELAGTLNDPHTKAILLHMAQVWLRLADEKDTACDLGEGHIKRSSLP